MSGSVASLGSSQVSSEIATVEARLQKPITQLQAEQTTDKAVISAWGAIQGTVSSLSSALAGIKDITTINNRAATSTLTNVATATATNTALAGTYDLTKVTLAKSQEIYSGVLGSGNANIGTGSGSFVNAQTAANASFNINGVPVSAATNTITTAVSGVTIALAGSGSTTINVSSSPGGIANAVGSVATNLNAAIAAIAKQTVYVPASSANAASASSAQSGPLLGNYTASDLTNQLLSRVSSAAASGQTSNTIGLIVSSTGSISFNSATFATAYAANPTGVTALVNKIYTNLSGVTTAALGSTGSNGTISAQDTAQTAAIASLQTEITSISKNNASQLQILLQEYTVTEAASTAASITQSYLSIFTNSGSSTSKG
jgi:flagellar hook-associated protein 2